MSKNPSFLSISTISSYPEALWFILTNEVQSGAGKGASSKPFRHPEISLVALP